MYSYCGLYSHNQPNVLKIPVYTIKRVLKLKLFVAKIFLFLSFQCTIFDIIPNALYYRTLINIKKINSQVANKAWGTCNCPSIFDIQYNISYCIKKWIFWSLLQLEKKRQHPRKMLASRRRSFVFDIFAYSLFLSYLIALVIFIAVSISRKNQQDLNSDSNLVLVRSAKVAMADLAKINMSVCVEFGPKRSFYTLFGLNNSTTSAILGEFHGARNATTSNVEQNIILKTYWTKTHACLITHE